MPTTVQLNSKDAALFIEFQRNYVVFQKHFAFVQMLNSLGVFDIENGSVEIFFQRPGTIGRIDIHKVYKPAKEGVDNSDSGQHDTRTL